jgi:hypothetical protein
VIEEIERLAIEARDLRRRVERASNPDDKRVMGRQLHDKQEQIRMLQERLPH